MKLRINRYIPCTESEGPGKRFTVWAQGCSIRCPGCFNKETWDKAGGKKFSVRRMLGLIKAEKGIEGITLLGGEPFDQARAFGKLAQKANKAGLSVMTFTGYSYEELLKRGRYEKRLLENSDILIDGRFIEAEKDYSRAYVGSRNQRYLFLSERYAHLKDKLASAKNRIEIRINDTGEIGLSGMGDPESFLNALEEFV